jgi:hypothetical protein
MELALCFEDVAKNIFGNVDGTMTRCASVPTTLFFPNGSISVFFFLHFSFSPKPASNPPG